MSPPKPVPIVTSPETAASGYHIPTLSTSESTQIVLTSESKTVGLHVQTPLPLPDTSETLPTSIITVPNSEPVAHHVPTPPPSNADDAKVHSNEDQPQLEAMSQRLLRSQKAKSYVIAD